MKFLCAILLLCSAKSFAQYPFEKYPVKKYDTLAFKIVDLNDSTQMAIAQYKNYTVKLFEGVEDGGSIQLYFKNKLIKRVHGSFSRINYVIQPLYIEDIDNDGRLDFIISSYYGGCSGLACSNIYTTYLINRGKSNFQAISYAGFYDKPQKEYEFKGSYRIIGQSLASFKGHNYWLFDIYDFSNGKLTNVSKKYGYPIAVPYLDNETFRVTNKIPKKQLERLSLAKPDLFTGR